MILFPFDKLFFLNRLIISGEMQLTRKHNDTEKITLYPIGDNFMFHFCCSGNYYCIHIDT